jgi:Flp pilus assembly protein TadG
MKPPAISRGRRIQSHHAQSLRVHERGVTMILVALAMVAIVAMAALSIDVTTLYLAREESQRAADVAALAAARVISVSGITGTANTSTDTSYWAAICGGSTSVATLTAKAAAQTNSVSNAVATITVSYSSGSGSSSTSNPDCSTLPQAFAVNPLVTVQVTRNDLPTLFSRIWGRRTNSVSATAMAEAFNPSDSGNVGNSGPSGTITPVQPRCVKPWVVPNLDPWNPAPTGGTYCNQSGGPGSCNPLVNLTTGQIQDPGISTGGTGTNGVIGETFWLVLDCEHQNSSYCQLRTTGGGGRGRGGGSPVQPQPNYSTGGGHSSEAPPNLLYVPGQVGTPVVAIPSCTQGNAYEEAIEGCDASTNYQCGVQSANAVDMSQNPDTSGASTNGVSCLIQQQDVGNTTSASGQDYLNAFGAPGSFPFQMYAGTSSPLGSGFAGSLISNSNSVVSLPIYDQTSVSINNGGGTTTLTFIGFLQVFVNAVDAYGNINVTVLNVAGCGNGTNSTGSPVTGSSPVPIRLITPPAS